MARSLPGVEGVLDLYPLAEHVTAAAAALHYGEGTAAGSWAERVRRRLLKSDGG